MLRKLNIVMMIVFSYSRADEKAIDEMTRQLSRQFSDLDLKNSKVFPRTITKYLKQSNLPGVKKENNFSDMILSKKIMTKWYCNQKKFYNEIPCQMHDVMKEIISYNMESPGKMDGIQGDRSNQKILDMIRNISIHYDFKTVKFSFAKMFHIFCQNTMHTFENYNTVCANTLLLEAYKK